MAEASSTERSDAEREEILDRMLTRLAVADDSKLQDLLSKILPYCIASLGSHSGSIRKAVLEILTHVNRRVKHQMDIGLPLMELWTMYSEANAAPMVKNFCIVYIEMALERAPLEVKANVAPDLVANISRFPPQHHDILLRIAAKVIGECHSNQVDEHIAGKYNLINGVVDRQIFVEFCLQTILYQPSRGEVCPAGLSIAQSDRITGKIPLLGDPLLNRKLGILNVIEAMELAPELVYPIYLAAISDGQEAVIGRGEDLLKRKAAGVNLEDPNLMKRLFMLFTGTVAENIDADLRISPGSTTLRTRLISVFCRSIAAANAFPSTLQCIFSCFYGSGTTSRLKKLGMEFTVWVFKHADIDQLKVMGPVILNGIMQILDGNSNAKSDVMAGDVKRFAFEAIGLLAQRLPQLFEGKIDMAVRLFDALKIEDQFLRLTIQEALNSLAMAYKGAPLSVYSDLEKLLLENSQVEQIEARFCAVRWATSLFGLGHCPSRYICMLGAADSKLDIREMALTGLFPMKDVGDMNSRNSSYGEYPKLKDMLDYICKQEPKLLDPAELREEKLLFPSRMFMAMVNFLVKSFEAEVQNGCEGDSVLPSSLVTLCLLLEHAMAFEGSAELHATAMKGIISIGPHFPVLIASRYAGRISWLKKLLGHVDSDTREAASRLLGIACSSLSTSEASDLICGLVSTVSGTQKSRFESQHGALCALGYVTAQCMTGTPTISEQLLVNTVNCLMDVVKSETITLASIALGAMGHMGLRGPLPAVESESTSAGLLIILQDRLGKLLSGDDIKAIQRIVISLGHISFKETSFALVNVALDLIFGLCRSKVEDVLFAAGEALAFIWGGVALNVDIILKSNYTSLSLSSNYLISNVPSSLIGHDSNAETDAIEESRVMARDVIVKKLFEVLIYSTRKEERCAGTVWLLSLIVYCGHHLRIQQLLPEIQEAFSHLLGEQNDLTQELASQGMSIVYELGDDAMKRKLVNALVNTLTGSGKRRRAVKLVEDSEVFQDGVGSESPSGGKLSTYKELCSLANEMGQPDLIYKFMDLANYQAMLNSKRGAAFGFSKIAKQAGDALVPYLRVLVPRLVRYQYDPDKNVQDAMGHIWKSLIGDPKRTIDEYLDPIFDDLLTQCGSRLWRSREASCLALADIIQGRRFGQVSKHLKRIWIAAFRAMDDIKETVRNAGDSLCRAASSLTTRLCDSSLTPISDVGQTMDIVLPLLLSEGIMSKVANIQKSSIGMVMKLSKGAGIAIRPHLPDLVCCMLEGLSSLEDQRLNYVELHAINVGIQKEKLENLRITAAKDSPMWETLDLCLKVVDIKSLDLLVPRLAQMIHSGVGLNTRVGVANFINSLVQKVGSDIKPFSSMLLKQLFPVVQREKSDAAKLAFAAACAVVLKYAGPSQAQKLIEDTAALHAGDRNALISCAILLKKYNSLAFDVTSSFHIIILPITFISRFDDNKDVADLFEELWEEIASNESAILQLYLNEIVSLLCDAVMSSSWGNKKKSAKAITKLCEVLGESISSSHSNLLQCLLKEIPGRLWEGKEATLYALAAICSSCHKTIVAEDPNSTNVIMSVLISSCSKKDRSYQQAAFSCVKEVVNSFGCPQFFNVVFPFLLEVCNQTCAKPGMSSAVKTDEESAEDVSAPLDKVVECVTSCINVAYVHETVREGKNLINVALCALSPGFSWKVKMSAFSLIEVICKKLSQKDDFQNSDVCLDRGSLIHELFRCVAPKVVGCISTVKVSQVHNSASQCLKLLAELYRTLPAEQREETSFMDELLHLHQVETSHSAKALLRECIDILKDIKGEKTPDVEG